MENLLELRQSDREIVQLEAHRRELESLAGDAFPAEEQAKLALGTALLLERYNLTRFGLPLLINS